MEKFREIAPSKPVLVGGALGGPFVIYTCTPLRNALTLGAQDRASGVLGLFRKTFRGGPQAGWTGGVAPSIIACPQFLALGPIFHIVNDGLKQAMQVPANTAYPLVPSVVASCCSGLCETLLTYGSQARNAQMAYNNSMITFSSVEEGVRKKLKLVKMHQIWGPGAGPMLTRNVISIGSVRTMAPQVRESVELPGLDIGVKNVLCDVMCSTAVCLFTAPVHQLFNFMVTTPSAVGMPRMERWKLAQNFLKQQYLVPKVNPDGMDFRKPVEYTMRISRTAARDFCMRTLYVTTVFSMYMSIERTLVAMMSG